MAISPRRTSDKHPILVLLSQLNVVFLSVVAIAVVWRFAFLDSPDPYKCKALITEGQWLDPPPRNSTVLPKIWKTPGCINRQYKPHHVSTCLSGKRFMFIGDSTIRQIFWATAKKLDPTVDPTLGDKHSDQAVIRGNIKIEFTWDPWLNGSRFMQELNSFVNPHQTGNPAALVLAGSGLWYAKYGGANPSAQWKVAMDTVLRYQRWAKSSVYKTRSDLLLLAPVTIPRWEKFAEEDSLTILPEEIAIMEEYLKHFADSSGTDIVWAFKEINKHLPQAYDGTGIHDVEEIAGLKADLLLNLRCNTELTDGNVFPVDGTCCNAYKPPNYIQWIVLVGMLLLPIASFISNDPDSSPPPTRRITRFYHNFKSLLQRTLPSPHPLHSLLIFGLAITYCYYADRTPLFQKSQKLFTNSDFFLLCFLTLLLGVLSIRQNSQDPSSPSSFLNREQTDEWKGWMQFLILIYHYTYSSQVTWIYDLIRLLVASYLFLTGYGHTVFFLTKNDYSLKRVLSVLVRLNLLSLALLYMLGTNYLFYYFAPLVTWWFIVVYTTLRVGAKYNSNTKFLVGKILLSALLVTIITKAPGILDAGFWLLRALARITWDLEEWRFRLSLDMWIVYIGMLSAIAYLRLLPSSPPISLPRWTIPISSLLLITYLSSQTHLFQTKFHYNRYHPYLSPLPILAYVALRNATPSLRTSHSAIFAWLGKRSLETFTLQFHIWLAADTRGLLTLAGGKGAGINWLNFVPLTAVFLIVCHHVEKATAVLTAWMVGAKSIYTEIPKAAAPRRPRPPRLPALPGSTRRSGDGDVEMQVLKKESGGEDGGGSRGRGGAEEAAGAGAEGKERNLAILVAVGLGVMWVMNLTYY